jgi:hypothetical protein
MLREFSALTKLIACREGKVTEQRRLVALTIHVQCGYLRSVCARV